MIISKKISWMSRILLIALISVKLTACASYPDDPRSPKVGDDTYVVKEDAFLSVSIADGILSNDKPEEGSRSILRTIGQHPTENGGLVVLAEDGSFTYEPRTNFNGRDQISYLVENEKGKQSAGMIFFDVTPVNDPPTPKDDILQTPTVDTIAIRVLDNDADPDGDSLQIVEVESPSMGSARATDANTIVFTPPANHTGTIKFKYIVADTAEERAEAWVSLRVVDVNNSIEATPDAMTTVEDTPSTLTVNDLLANDRDLLNSPLSVVEISGAQNGTVVLDGSNFTYSPNADFFGTDTFTYTVQSERGSTASAMVTATVTPVNDPPTISAIGDQTIRAGQTTGTILTIPFTIEDLDNAFTELTLVAEPSAAEPPNLLPVANISLSGTSANRVLQITTQPNLSGTATITIVAGDGELTTSQSFGLRITPPPVALHRYHNPSTGDHFYTTIWSELGEGTALYRYEGIECYIFSYQASGTLPLYRYYNAGTGDHFYTTNWDELGQGAYGFVYEFIAGYVYPNQTAETIPLYRYYHAGTGDHFYTVNWDALGPGAYGYAYGGIAGYVFAAP